MGNRKEAICNRPLIGVFVKKKLIGNQTIHPFAKKIYQANECVKCTVFFFSSGNIQWEKKTIEGYIPTNDRRKWQVCRLPFPDIIYDRAACMTGKERTEAEALRTRLKKYPGIQFINNCRLGKWHVYQKLQKYTRTKKYLPATMYSTGMDDIKAMLASYGFLFLKASGGSGGKGVFALKRSKHGYRFYYYHKGFHVLRSVNNLRSLCTEMNMIGLKPNEVIIQQGVNLINHNTRPLDLRVLMVKDRHGVWNAVYNQARIAPKGAVITNVSLGGKVMNYSDIYHSLKTRYTCLPSEEKIRNICMTIAYYIEKALGPFGEIGIDIGIDTKGKIWLLEANSKPSKLPEKNIEDTIGISPQFRMILEYGRYLYDKKTSRRTQADTSP